MTTAPVDLSTQASQTTLQNNVRLIRNYNFTIKKGPTLINAKKLPKDFFINHKEKIKETRTALKKPKEQNQCKGRSQRIAHSNQNCISQNKINLNQFHFEDIPEAQVTSCFGFIEPNNSQTNRFTTPIEQKKNLPEKHFDDLKIKYQSDFKNSKEIINVQKNFDSKGNKITFRKDKYGSYPQNFENSQNNHKIYEMQKCCSIQLNCQNQNQNQKQIQNLVNNRVSLNKINSQKSQQSFKGEENFNRFTFHNPNALNKSNLLECTFAGCQTDAQACYSINVKNLRKNKKININEKISLRQTKIRIDKKLQMQKLKANPQWQNELCLKRQKGKSVQMRRPGISTQRKRQNNIQKKQLLQKQKMLLKYNSDKKDIGEKINLPPINNKAH